MKIKGSSWLIKYASMFSDVVKEDWEYVLDSEGNHVLDSEGYWGRKYTKTTDSCSMIAGVLKTTVFLIVIAFLACVIAFMLGSTLGWIAVLISEGRIALDVIGVEVFMTLMILGILGIVLAIGFVFKVLDRSSQFNSAVGVLARSVSAKAEKVCLKIDVE